MAKNKEVKRKNQFFKLVHSANKKTLCSTADMKE